MSMDWAGLIRRGVYIIGGKKPTGGCKHKRVCDVPEVRDTELRDTELRDTEVRGTEVRGTVRSVR